MAPRRTGGEIGRNPYTEALKLQPISRSPQAITANANRICRRQFIERRTKVGVRIINAL
jgi:hypothetical protein